MRPTKTSQTTVFLVILHKCSFTLPLILLCPKNIIHLSSKDLKSGKEYNSINRPKNVIHWNGDLVYVFNISSAGREVFMTIDLENNKIVSTGHYIEKPDWEFGYAYSQYFDCIRG